MDYEAIAADLIRALRGRRSQTAFSRRLGYKSNVVYRWESGRAWPTAAVALRAARKVGVDLKSGLNAFYRANRRWVARTDLATPEGVALLLSDLRGSTPIGELARRAGRSRFAVARWLKGEAEPRLPELLLMVQAASMRLLDFLCIFTDPAGLPSTAADWEELQAAREAAYTTPWAPAVLLALDLEDYVALPKHEPGWLARRLGIGQEEEDSCLELLARTRQIRRHRKRWAIYKPHAVDTRAQPERQRPITQWWTRTALDRMGQGEGQSFSYTLFTVSAADLERIKEAHDAFVQQMRGIITESKPNQRLVLFSSQLVPLERAQAGRARRR